MPPEHPRVLLVEDEMMLAMALEDFLHELDYEVVGPVARVDEALEMARHEAFDAAILDINLDGNEVYPVAEALAARDMPFAFTTGYGKEGLRAPWQDRPVLQKPFRPEELEDLLTALSGAGC